MKAAQRQPVDLQPIARLPNPSALPATTGPSQGPGVQHKRRGNLNFLTWPFIVGQMMLAEIVTAKGAAAAENDPAHSGSDSDASSARAHANSDLSIPPSSEPGN